MYIRQMSALSGASSLDWMRKNIADDMSFADIEANVRQIPIGSDGVLFLPYLFGERAPFRLPNASAAFLGLRVHHTKYHMIKAVYEGIAMALHDCYQNLPKHKGEIYLAGGGAQSNLLCQTIADCEGETVVRNQTSELGLLGVLYLLLKATGMTPKINNQNLTYFYPDDHRHEKYLQMYKSYEVYKNAMIKQWELFLN